MTTTSLLLKPSAPDLWPDLADPFETSHRFVPTEAVPYAPLFTGYCGGTPVRMTFDGWDLWFVLADVCNAVGARMYSNHWTGIQHRVHRWTPDLGRDRLRTLSLPDGRLLTLVSSPGIQDALERMWALDAGAHVADSEWTALSTFVEEQTARLAPRMGVRFAQCGGWRVRVRVKYDGSRSQHWFALDDVLRLAGVTLSGGQDPTSDRWALEAYLHDRSTSAPHDGCSCLRPADGPPQIVRDVQDGKRVDMVTTAGISAAFHHLYVVGLYRAPVTCWPLISDLEISSWADGLDGDPEDPEEDEEPPYGYITPEWPQGYGVPTPRQPESPVVFTPGGLADFYPKPGPQYAPCESVVEQKFWDAHLELNAPELAGLVTQHNLWDCAYRLDFALPHRKIAIEIDGWEFHGLSKDQFSRDRKRWRDIERGGWRLLRFSGREIMRNAYGCVQEAASWVREVSQ